MAIYKYRFLVHKTAIMYQEIFLWYLKLKIWCILDCLKKNINFQIVLDCSSFTEETCITVLAQCFLKNQATS